MKSSEAGAKTFSLPNTDFDTGKTTRAGEYKLSDQSYAYLLDKLAAHNFENVTPELRENILAFYADLNAPIATKDDADDWQKTQDELQKLREHTPQESSPAKAAPAS